MRSLFPSFLPWGSAMGGLCQSVFLLPVPLPSSPHPSPSLLSLTHTNTHIHVGKDGEERPEASSKLIMTPMFHREPNAEYFAPLFLLFGIFLIFFFLEHILTL